MNENERPASDAGFFGGAMWASVAIVLFLSPGLLVWSITSITINFNFDNLAAEYAAWIGYAASVCLGLCTPIAWTIKSRSGRWIARIISAVIWLIAAPFVALTTACSFGDCL
jgi:hypothetical protein